MLTTQLADSVVSNTRCQQPIVGRDLHEVRNVQERIAPTSAADGNLAASLPTARQLADIHTTFVPKRFVFPPPPAPLWHAPTPANTFVEPSQFPTTYYTPQEGEAFLATLLDEGSAAPLKVFTSNTPVIAVFHVAPIQRRYALLRFTLRQGPDRCTFATGAFPTIKTATYVIYVTQQGSHLLRYSGSRKRNLSFQIPEILAFVDRCTSRNEVEILLQAAGIEPNPGPSAGPIMRGVAYGLVLRFGFGVTGLKLIPLSILAGGALEAAISAPMLAYYRVTATRFYAYVWYLSNEVLNALAHMTYGNTSLADRKRLNKKAFNFDLSDPFTWKFDENEARNYVNKMKFNSFVILHGPAWVVEKMLMRRGVKLSDAFVMVKERYAQNVQFEYAVRFQSNPDRLLPEVPDLPIPAPLEQKIVNDEPLNARDRRALRRVTKQSKLFGMMPDLGVTSTISDATYKAADTLRAGLSSHGESVNNGFATLGGDLKKSSLGLGVDLMTSSSTLSNSLNTASAQLFQAVRGVQSSFLEGVDRITASLANVKVTHSFAPITSENLPVLAKSYLTLLTDVMPMIISDDPLVALAMQPSLIARHGWLTTAVLDALVLTTKQLIKWITGVTKQVDTNRVDESILLTMYNVVYALIFQGLPSGTPGNLKDRLLSLNALATFVKNASSLFTFVVELFKTCVNWIYESFTGVPYFDTDVKEILHNMAELDARATEVLHKKGVPSLDDLNELSNVRLAGDKLMPLALTHPEIEKQTLRFKRVMEAVSAYHSSVAFDAEMNEGRKAPIIIRIYGTGGQGKTTLVNYLVAALHAKNKWPSETPEMSQVEYEYGVNFQPKIKPYSRVLIIDDPFVVNNQEVAASVLAEIIKQGNSRPKKREGAAIDDKENMYEHFEVVMLLDMGIRADAPINDDFALARRMTGGQFRLTANKDYVYADGTLNYSSFTVNDIDKVWNFESQADGKVLTFRQVVAFLQSKLEAFKAGRVKVRDDIAKIAQLALEWRDEVPVLARPVSFIRPETTEKPTDPPQEVAKKQVSTLLNAAKRKAPVVKQVKFTEAEMKRITNAVGISEKKVANYGSFIPGESLDKIPVSVLSNELDMVVDEDDPLDAVIQHLKLTVEKGKEKEQSPSDKDSSDEFKDVVEAGGCIFKAGTCLEHGLLCSSKLEEPRPLSRWEAISALAPKLKLPGWMARMASSLKAYGWLIPSVPAVLAGVVSFFAAKIAVSAVSMIFTSVLGPIVTTVVEKQAYSTTYARIPAAKGAKLGYARQMYLSQYKEGSDEWLANKIHGNTTPIIVPVMIGSVYGQSGNMTAIAGNVHVTTKHQFIDYPLVGKIALLGMFGITYELREFKYPQAGEKPAIDTTLSVVWWTQVPDRDLAIVVTPRSGMIFQSIGKYFASEDVSISQLLDNALVMSTQSETELDDKTYQVVKSEIKPYYLHGAGDAVSIDRYAIEGSPIGLSIRCPERTLDGSCGRLWFTRSTRVGKGYKKIHSLHGGYDDDAGCAISVPICEEDIRDWMAIFAHHAPLSIAPNEDVIANGGKAPAQVVAVGTLPKGEGANQNLKNPIQRSPAYNLLTGLEVTDPISRQSVLLPPPSRVPVDLRGPEKALQKMPFNTAPWSEDVIRDYEMAAAYVGTKMVAQLDQAFIDRLYIPTIDHVLNGDPNVDSPGIDMSTSVGYGLTGPGKHAIIERRDDGLLHMKSEDNVRAIIESFARGELPLPLVVDNGKAELRPPEKVMRNTSCYQAELCIAAKVVLYWVSVVVKYGRIDNNTLYGVDLNSQEGQKVFKKLTGHPYKNEGDYKNYDATIQPEQADIVGREILLPIVHFLRRHGVAPYPDETYLAALRTQTLTVHIFGSTMYIRWFGNTSGGILTTPFNCFVGASNQAFCWLRFHRDTGRTREVWEDFEENYNFAVYGDDYAGATSVEAFDNFVISKHIATLGQVVTPALKGTDFTAHVDRTSILKRTPSVQQGRVHWLLPVEVLVEIHAFRRDASVSAMEALRTNMDAALREWYHYGRETFSTVKAEFNAFLAAHSGAPLLLTFEELDRNFKSAGNNVSRFGVSKQSSLARFLLLPPAHVIKRSTALSAPNRCGRGVALHKRDECTPPSSHSLALLCPYKRAANNVSTSTSSTVIGDVRGDADPIVSTNALTSFNDDTAVTSATPPQVLPAAIPRTDPYPDQGMREVLSREYRVADVTWPTSAAAGTLLFTGRFPELLFTIPNIQDKLKSFRYMRAGAKVSLRVNSNGFAGGTLMVQYIPFYNPSADGAWRHKFWPLAQTGPMLMSASRAETLQLTIPWAAPFMYRDLRTSNNPGMIGSVFVYVLNPLVFSNTGAPSSLSVSVFASFDNPEVAGPDINGAPASSSSVKKQSGEAMIKTVKGVIAGVTRATSTVAGIVKPFTSSFGLPFLNKPTSLAATQPMTLMPARGMANASGLDTSAKLSLDPEAQVSVSPSIFGGGVCQPTWRDVLSIPALIHTTSFTQAAAADTLIASWPVRPNYAKTIAANTFAPGNLAYYANFFKRWRGGIVYALHFACPSNVTARVRVSFLPNVSATTAPPESQAGDIISKVLSITGDTVLMFPIEYLGDTYFKKCQNLSVTDTSDIDAVGRVSVTVLNEVVSVNTAATTPIALTVWMAAAENFVYSQPDDFPPSWAPNFTLGVTKQTSLRDLFAKPASGMVPTTLLMEEGIVTPEKFTGPLDLLHRQCGVSTILTNGDYLRVQPIANTAMWQILLPFLGWRGSLRYKGFPEAAHNVPYAIGWVASESDTTFLSGYQGFLPGSIGEWETPYYDYYAWRETYPIMTVVPRDAIRALSAMDGKMIYFGYAVGDDFSIGLIYGPPCARLHPSAPEESLTGSQDLA